MKAQLRSLKLIIHLKEFFFLNWLLCLVSNRHKWRACHKYNLRVCKMFYLHRLSEHLISGTVQPNEDTLNPCRVSVARLLTDWLPEQSAEGRSERRPGPRGPQ